MRLANKVSIVTGGGRGIGAAIAARFCEEGATVAILELDEANGERVAAELTAKGGTAAFLHCDVTDQAAVADAIDRASRQFGAPNVLVNNAGANSFHEPLRLPEGEWERCMRLDLDAAWYCARAVLPAMRDARSGSIINIASTQSFQIIPHTFPYPVAKHALLGLTRALAIEYAADGVRVNAIAPGYIETQIAVDYWNTFPDPDAERRRACDLHPPKRIGRPVEVANTAVFLASDEATFINAETIVVDGGRSKLYHD
jgi:NAD(P)-dependent dehydrogenase (short-subunit alcohol dehydrogenase family)